MIRSIKNIAKIFLGISVFTGTAHAAAFQFGGLRLDTATVTSSASSTALTKSDAQLRIVSGSTADEQKLPSATTLQAGYWYGFQNIGTGPLTILDSSSTLLGFVEPGAWAQLIVRSTSTSGGPWVLNKGGYDNAACTTPSSGGTGVLIVDWRLGPCFAITLSANTGIVFTNRPTLQRKTIFLRFTNTASNFTVSYQSANVLWPSGTVPTETVGAKIDAITCDHDPATGKTICNSVQGF
jgi:hypothetical protein